MKKTYCVISHTHWDREWYFPFENFRMRLCNLINSLFDIIEEYPNYIFHLDAQVIVLEDYLEIYPQNSTKLKQYIKKGNIIVGPWYLQNDFYLTSGEATIRNLLIGTRLAKKFGQCDNVGYAPDQFGNISQLPQILNNFGIDNFIFGRGFNPYTINDKGEKYLISIPSEFIWQGADGSEVLAVHLRSWYNNAQRFSADIKKAKILVERIEKSFENVAATPYLLLMNGVDHLEAQEDLLPILEKLNLLDINGEIKQTKMSDYINYVKTYIADNDIALERFSGEMRKGGDVTLLQGTLSSRHYLKVENVKAQNLLENRIEPLYSMLTFLGFKGVYPQNFLYYLWKTLLKNHPHDSICGCSRDEVHRQMETRFERVNVLGNELLQSALEIAAYHNGVVYSDKDYSIILANTTCACISGLVEVYLSIPVAENVTNFEITDMSGEFVEFEIAENIREKRDVFSAINLPGVIDVDTYKIYLSVREMKPMSFVCYKVTAKDGKLDLIKNSDLSNTCLENDKLLVEVTNEGSVNIICKKNLRKINDCLWLEDTADKGTSYNFVTAGDQSISSKSFKPVIKMLESNKYKSVCSISYDMQLPEYFDFDNNKRSKNRINEHCEIILTLKSGSDILEVDYKIDNKAKDHRLRLVVKTDVISDYFIADIPFDTIQHDDNDINPLVIDNVHPNTSFALIESDTESLAVLTEGAHECAKIGCDTIVLTLVRSTGAINHDSGKQWLTPENNCLRFINGKIGIYPFSKYDSPIIPLVSTIFRNPILTMAVPADIHKFTGGRPAVQDTEISELFFKNDKYSDIRVSSESVLSCSDKRVLITAFKKAENNDGFIVRLFNTSNLGLNTKVNIKGEIYASNMNEQVLERIGSNEVVVNMRGKQILTLYIK